MENVVKLLKSYGVFKRLLFGLALLFTVFVIGISGFMLIENYNFIDAVYMSIITLSTVGFGEVTPLSDNGKIFTSLLIFLSVATYGYAITVITSYIIEGEFRMYFKHLRVNNEIQKLSNHVVVCGYGRNGKQACQQLASGNFKFVVIENNPQLIQQFREDENILFVEGNATEDAILEQAGIKNAKGLITTLPDDANNVFVALTARELNPTMKIISRASSDNAESKLKRAGADNVIMPDKIGGTHMAALMTKPDVLEFIDFITSEINIRMEEIHFNSLSDQYKNKSIREMEIRNKTGASVIGYKISNGQYIINPQPDTIMVPESKIFVLGTQDQVSNLIKILKSGE